MKKHFLTLFSAAMLVAVVLSSCGKYEDGPGFTVLTKRMRLERSWDLDEVMNEAGNSVKDNSSDYWTLEKDGVAKFIDGSDTYTGNWALENDDANLKVTVTYPILGVVTIGDYEIKRLTSKEMWLYNPTSKNTEKYVAK
jgi:hypothetical protein